MANDDAISGAFARDDSLHVTRQGQTYSVRAEPRKEPNQWKVVHYANVGTSEPFVDTFSGELRELLAASHIPQRQREAIEESMMSILVDGLLPAFTELRKVRGSVTNPMPELERLTLYKNFVRALWTAYKGQFQNTVKLLGFDIGFLFEADVNFERGLTEFVSKSPSLIMDVPELLRRQRVNWQQGLATFRISLDHPLANEPDFTSYYEPKKAEMLFEHCWRTMAELLPVFIETRFSPAWSIAEIPIDQRDPNRPRRWRFFQREPVERSTFPA